MATKKETAPVEELEEKKLEDMTPEEQKAYWNEKVPFKAFKDAGRYKDDITVGVNGRVFQIQRGKTVMVPRYVREILEQSEKQDISTANMIEDLTSDFEAESKKRGIEN